MPVTLQQIADAAGVSRGTVDRALNHRGRINPQVAERVRALAKEMGYHRNRAARALAMAQRSVRLGVIVQAADTPFMKNVLEGIQEAKKEIEGMGGIVELRIIREIDSNQLINAMKELAVTGCKGIALVPSDDKHVAAVMREMTEDGIHFVTFNSDLEDSGRLCYVGQDSYQSGKTAGGLMAEILPKGGRMLVVSGYPKNRSHCERERGFLEELKKLRTDISFLETIYVHDSDEKAEIYTREIFEKEHGLDGIYLASAGINGVCKALEELDPTHQVKVILNDMTQDSIKLLKTGAVRFLIDQNARMQGMEPIQLLFSLLFDNKKPKKEFYFTNIEIKTRHNVE